MHCEGKLKFRSQNASLLDAFVWCMVFNANFNNISVISWQSVLLMEETGVPGENHRPVASHWQTSSLKEVATNEGLTVPL
jgi:hypothetical protein